jgi:hypothetical protein
MRSLLALFARTNSITLSDAAAAKVSQTPFLPVSLRQLASTISFTSCRSALYTAIENMLKPHGKFLTLLQSTIAIFLLFSLCLHSAYAQGQVQKPAGKPPEKKPEKTAPPKKPDNPAQIELLETRYRFEVNGESRKEVHARVHINSELGVRQFARLDFDYNRAFESIEIPLVRITHPGGGTADILPGSITDNPNPAVVNAPAYQNVRAKSVRILGLRPGDWLEYRVITTVSNHPFAPDFWLDHDFDRSGVVSKEVFELDLPASIAPSPDDRRLDNKPKLSPQYDPFRVLAPGKVDMYVNPDTPVGSTRKHPEASGMRTIFLWRRPFPVPPASSTSKLIPRAAHDVELALSRTWAYVSISLYGRLTQKDPLPAEVLELSKKLTEGVSTPIAQAEKIYDYVSQKIATVDLPLGATAFQVRSAEEIIATSHGTSEDKFSLFAALAKAVGLQTWALLAQDPAVRPFQIPSPAHFAHLLAWVTDTNTVLDPSAEVAPFGVIAANLRGKQALNLGPYVGYKDHPQLEWTDIPRDLPFPSTQQVEVDATLASDGELTAKVHYSMRGDNELLLRVAFHEAPKEKWKELAQLLSITDGFRGQVSSVSTSDPYATREPFTLDYEITMPKFVDWSKKPVRIPALLPQLGLPDPPAKPVPGAATSPIELGTPLEVETRMTLHLPPGTTAQTPTGTSVQRDYATYASQYSTKDSTISASRHINFLSREIPANRAVDYNAFLRAVQSDEAQDFTLARVDSSAPEKKPAAPKSFAPTQAAGAQPNP